LSVDERPLRLFVAVDVPIVQRKLLQDSIEPHAGAFEGARWTAPENQHVTLKFLGATARSGMEQLDRSLRAAAEAGHRGRVGLSELGVFPTPTKARVLWAGLTDPAFVLATAAAALDAALHDLGYGVEQRGFTPHLTLARFKHPVRLKAPLRALPAERFPSFEVDRIVLYSSRLHPTGARYEALAAYPLGATGTDDARDEGGRSLRL
jgi:RNA 2',3'-cyclic 3'-phosphodiesterase